MYEAVHEIVVDQRENLIVGARHDCLLRVADAGLIPPNEFDKTLGRGTCAIDCQGPVSMQAWCDEGFDFSGCFIIILHVAFVDRTTPLQESN